MVRLGRPLSASAFIPCPSCKRYFRVDTLKELFEIVESRNIIAFIKDINFYQCI